MSTPFKDHYNADCAAMIAGKIHRVRPSFDVNAFVHAVRTRIDDAGFFERQDIFADALEATLGDDHAKNLRTFTRILGPKLETSTGMFTHGWWLWPISRYMERHALEDREQSRKFIYELTQRFTGEFAIRPLLEAHPQETLRMMLVWSRDPSVHVRRLASEGVRMRLPWARKSTVALIHFGGYTTILNALHSDPERFVQKSVGNNVNDLMKEDPERARSLVLSWCSKEISPHTAWVIRHGMRNQPAELSHFSKVYPLLKRRS